MTRQKQSPFGMAFDRREAVQPQPARKAYDQLRQAAFNRHLNDLTADERL